MTDETKNQHSETSPEDAQSDTASDGSEGSGGTETLESLRDQCHDLESRLLRVSADYQNYVRRSNQNVDAARREGLQHVAVSILSVLDHFDQALKVDAEKTSVATVLDGMKIVHDELTKVLRGFGIEKFEPAPGDEFDPNRHEALMRQEAKGVKSNQIVATLQPGYELDQKTIRPAKVTVAP